MATHDCWRPLLDNLRETIEVSKADKPNREKKQNLINALDRVFDEIKSGEYNHSGSSLLQNAQEVFNLFKDLLSHFDDWSFKQSIAFALVHFYFIFEKQELIKLLINENEDLLNLILENITDSKREVRDATSQSLGGLSKVIGADFLKQDFILDILNNPKKKQPEEPYKSVEGMMNTLGYILRNCSIITHEQFTFMTDILFNHATDSQFGSYSSYVRRYAVRSLTKSLESPIILGSTQLLNRYTESIFTTFKDQDIDVRRANGQLFIKFLMTLIQVGGVVDSISVESVISDLIQTLNQDNIQWQQRHGVCLAFEAMSLNTQIFNNDSTATNHTINIVEIVKQLYPVLEQQMKKKEQDKAGSNGNAIAAKSICNFFMLQSIKYNIVDQLQYVQDMIIHMLKSDDPLLLDAGNYSVIQLITKFYNSTTTANNTQLNNLLSLVYKNTFHASYPIKSGAMLSLSRAVECMKLADTQDLITVLTANIVNVLVEESKHTNNYEVKESVFKAMEDLFTKTKSLEPITNLELMNIIFDVLIKNCTDKSCGSNSDYPRSACINALSSYLVYINKYSQEIDKFIIKNQLKLIIKLLNTIIGEEEMIIVISSIKLARVIDLWYNNENYNVDMTSLYGSVLCLSYDQDDEIKYNALPLRTSMIGSVNTEKIVNICKSLSAEILNDDVDEDKRIASSMVLKFLASHPAHLTSLSGDVLKKLFTIVAKGLLLEDNRESKVIQANCLLLLRELSKNMQFKTFKHTNHIMLLLINLLANKKSFDYEVDFDEEDESEEDSEDEKEDLELKYPGKLSSSKINAQRCKVIVDIILNVEPELIDYFNAIKTILGLYKQTEANVKHVSYLASLFGSQHNFYELNPTVPKLQVDDLMESLEDMEVPVENDSEDAKLFILDNVMSIGGGVNNNGADICDNITSPYYNENLIINTINNGDVEEDALIDSLNNSIQDEEDENITKYAFVLSQLLSKNKALNGEYEDLINTIIEKVTECSMDESVLVWLLRLLETIAAFDKEFNDDKVYKFATKIDKYNSKVFIAACSCILQVAVNNGKLNEIVQTVSDLLVDEDIDEGKDLIQYVLHRNNIKLPLPTPKVDNVKSNETFAATQSK
ncbi:hypothetical protein NAEGRDRAFT_78043 [Naegleria gruberi]|uniref:Uncharacterized protein n=1 Tax=Naegleria gruberi TaxID=5762 RepID=D2V0H1_NAEGR|nr:uncharacterized protein NAEGRDRAFT_78043 [Naegleria gruberi]EFC49720.1 hypothetical protein NAEGRDRAFT_78043 [Naegleria gruberi]|eukprot:XP_002682464.1 hypothetical protein NAEGRDRAFT_78043 [Naegleria gruberi strain NEG-M]